MLAPYEYRNGDKNINNKGTDDKGREYTRPTSTFKTRGDKSRTFTMVMTSPNVYLYDDGSQWLENAATMFKTEPMPDGIEQRHAWFMPATFQVYGLSTPDGGALPFAFNIDRVVPVWETGPARLMVGVVDVHIGAPDTLRAIPIETFTDEAMKLAQVIVNVQPQVRPLDSELWVYRLSEGSPRILHAQAVEHVPHVDQKSRVARGKKSRGPTTISANEHKWNDPEMVAFAAKCYNEGMNSLETSQAFGNIKQAWTRHTVDKQWALATDQGLMTRNRRTKK